MIHLEPRHLESVRHILQRYVPEFEVWAFGSRVHGRNLKPFSDLDLAIITDQPLSPARYAALEEAFSESDLPFKVDIVDWATTSENFRTLIEADRSIVQGASPKAAENKA